MASATTAAAAVPQSSDKHSQEGVDSVAAIRETSPKSLSFTSNSATQHRDSLQNNDLRAIQRPQAKKLPPKNIGAIPPPPQREPIATTSNSSNVIGENDSIGITSGVGGSSGCSVLSTSMLINRKDPPPLPPPRPHRHGRSSSLDLNKFKIGTPSCAQPEVSHDLPYPMAKRQRLIRNAKCFSFV